ncbi:hypothetical protein O3M35_004574 [Rhynocoris fuscipes]|uniref:dihydropyrimidinase n=1 Tax=Rhynocoris fuscipes TaxID=488301 RepID=A0AAW1CFZ7_9HEMI
MMSTNPVKKVPIHLQSSQNRLLLKHGKVVNASGIIDADVYIEDGIIKELGKNLIIPGGTRTLDVRGLYVMPGGIDPHTHFELELMGHKVADDFYHGTKAAIAGGTTMIMDFVIPNKNESLLDAYDRVRSIADEKACCDYSLHVCVTQWNEKVKEEMEILCNERGINSFKTFMDFKDLFMLDDSDLYWVFAKCKELGALPMVHAENGNIISENEKVLIEKGIVGPEGHDLARPEEVEAEAVNRACVIAKQVSSPIYIDGLTSKSAADIVKNHKDDENKVIGAVMASSLGIDLMTPMLSTTTCPPIRPHSSLHLIQLLAEGLLHVTGSDNCTFTSEQKDKGQSDFTKIPLGVNGVEDRMSVVWEKGVESGAMSLSQFVAITSTNAAKIFNIFPKKGCIAVGSDADIVVWNHTKTRTISAQKHHQATDINIFEGMTVHGAPEFVIVNGRVCYEDGEVRAVQGFGSFIPNPTCPPYLYPQEENQENEERVSLENGSETADVESAGAAQKADDEHMIWTDPVKRAAGKGQRLEGQRNLQDSTFSISCELDDTERRSCIRVFNPPGGQSSGGFW